MSFFQLHEMNENPLVNGITIKAVYGGSSSISFLTLPPLSHIPPHHHPSEQIGVVLSGELEYTIGDETMVCHEGTTFVIPPNTTHSGIVVSRRPAHVLDLFTPPRRITETLQYIDEET